MPRPAPARRRPPRPVLLAAGAAALVVVLGLAGFVFFRDSGNKPATTGSGQPAVPPAPPVQADATHRLKLLVPAYIYPAAKGQDDWDRIIESPAAADTVAIVNPSSGPGQVVDANYTRVLEHARRKGVTVIGYVSTRHAQRPLAEVKGDVDRWVRLYPKIQGIFFDEQASMADQVPYYTALYEYARKQHNLSLVVTNPGTVCAEEFLGAPAADVVCPVEAPRGLADFHPPAWMSRYPASRFAALLCEVATADDMRKSLVAMRDKHIGYCYVTDAKLNPNPWGQLPGYWKDEVDLVHQLNEGTKPAP